MAALSLAGCSDDENGNGGNGGNGGSGEGGNPSGGDLTEILFEDGTQIGDGRQEFEIKGDYTLPKGTYLLKGWCYIADGASLASVSDLLARELAIGGVFMALGMVLLGLASKWIWQMELPLWYLAVIGIAANLFGQLGDLSMSLIKREAGIKDYSHIFLTLGGVLDRFDSTLFLAPVVYAMLFLLEKLV